MKDHILESARLNLDRVRNLVAIYQKVTGEGPGRRGMEDTDLLRAAVVFLHATLEEFLRELERWKLPAAGADKLNDVALHEPGKAKRAGKYQLGDLVRFRGQTIDEVIAVSIDEHLERSNYNNLEDVSAVLSLCGLIGRDHKDVDDAKEALLDSMKRRHMIVHQADRQEQAGKGFGAASPIDKATVDKWIANVGHFVDVVGGKL